jgi:photosystem II stability/assembly factor-like uncharacterized protein
MTSHSGWLWGSPQPQGHTVRALAFQGLFGLAVGDFGTLLRTEDGGDTWSGVATGTTEALTHAEVLDEDSALVAGHCSIMRSDDGGRSFARLSWNPTGVGCDPPIAAVAFAGDRTGLVALDDGMLLRTVDGGTTWSLLAALPGSLAAGGTERPTDVAASSVLDAVATTDGGHIYRTNDAGDSWTLAHSHSAPLRGLDLLEGGTGYAVGDRMSLLRTTNGGLTWSASALEGDLPLASIRCAPSRCLVTVGLADRLLETKDGGATLSEVPQVGDGILAVAFSSAERAVAAGIGGTMRLSGDSGASWSRLGRRLPGGFTRVRALSSSTAFAVGAPGAIARTDDGGVTWRALEVPTDEPLIDVSFASSNRGFVIDQDGRLLQTVDGGSSWLLLRDGGYPLPQAVAALGAQVVLLVGGRGILRSTDGGETFTRPRDPLVRWPKLFNVDRVGRAIFAYGTRRIVVSTDRGRTWRAILRPRRTQLLAADFTGRRTGYALSLTGQVYKTRAGGRPWHYLGAVGSDDVKGLSFSGRRGYLALTRLGGDASGYLLRTSNGGRSWRPQLVTNTPVSPDGLLATRGTDFVLADGRTILFTRAGGDRGRVSTIRLRASRRSLPRRGRVRLTGIVTSAEPGTRVIVSLRERGEGDWHQRVVRVTEGGRFETTWRVRKTSTFLAQWAGDATSRGDSSRRVVVRVVGP